MGAIETEVIVDKPKQFSMEGAPGKVLAWGIVLAVLGAGFVPQGQEFRIGLQLALSVVRELLVPLGAALIAAGIVMGFIRAQYPRRESVRHNWK